MMMLKDGIYPRIFSFKEMMDEYLAHMQMVLRKSFEYDLREATSRLEILEGYLKALGCIDDIVDTIKKSESKEIAIRELSKRFDFSKRQSEAILELKLQRLVNLEYIKLKKEFDDLTQQVQYLNFILTDEKEFRAQVIKNIKRISDEYGDARRTINMTLGTKTDTEEVIEEKNLIVYFTNYGNLYADETTTLVAQRKGGRGSKIKLEKGEAIVKTVSGKNTSSLLAFSNIGRAFNIQLEDLLASTNTNALLQLEPDENIIEIALSDKTQYIVFITKNGLLKKSNTEIYNIKQKGVVALKLIEGDSLIKVLFMNQEKIALLTKNGIFKIIESSSINPIGRVAQGVICIKLDEGDVLVDAQIIERDSKEIISVTRDGLSIRVPLDDFKVSGRQAKGKQLQKGELVGFVLVTSQDKEVAISSSQNIIKIPINSITLVNRGAIGARAIALKDSIITGVIKEL
jgi:DNA gyrase subunit A